MSAYCYACRGPVCQCYERALEDARWEAFYEAERQADDASELDTEPMSEQRHHDWAVARGHERAEQLATKRTWGDE